MLKNIFLILFCTFISTGVVFGDYAKDLKQAEIQEVEGRVASIDWVASSLILKYLIGATYEEIKLYFPKEAKIIKSNKEIQLSDIDLSDLLRVEYFTDEKEKKDVVVRVEVVTD